MRRAVGWLAAIQNADGGWGEDGASYKLDYRGYEPAPSTPSQTAWALLGLMAAGEADNPAVERGVAYLARDQGDGRLLAGGALHGGRLPARLLSALSRLSESSSRSGRWRAIGSLRTGNSRVVAFGM